MTLMLLLVLLFGIGVAITFASILLVAEIVGWVLVLRGEEPTAAGRWVFGWPMFYWLGVAMFDLPIWIRGLGLVLAGVHFVRLVFTATQARRYRERGS